MTSAVIPPFTETYSYDPWGNQVARTLSAGTGFQWNYTPTTSNQATGSGMTYDAAGNLLTDGLHSYSYDAESRVSAVTDQSVMYSYDPEGKRVATVAGGAVSAEYLYDMAGSLVTTVTNQGQMGRTILRDNGGMHWGDYVGSAGAGGLRTEFRLVNQVGAGREWRHEGELHRGLPERALRRRSGLHPELRLHGNALCRQAEGRGNGER